MTTAHAFSVVGERPLCRGCVSTFDRMDELPLRQRVVQE
jgi:hypothetical protein